MRRVLVASALCAASAVFGVATHVHAADLDCAGTGEV